MEEPVDSQQPYRGRYQVREQYAPLAPPLLISSQCPAQGLVHLMGLDISRE